MRRIVYVSPDSNSPTGGIKVIYRHAQVMRELGFDAHVMHFAEGFRCDWFASEATVITLSQLRTTDIVVIPEIMTRFALQLHGLGIDYCMFVQNGYLVLPTADFVTLKQCYENAMLVLSISDDTTGIILSLFPNLVGRCFRLHYSVDRSKFKCLAKQDIVTYMPRKLPLHASNVVPWLAQEFPHWTFQPLHGMPEAEVAAALGRSRIFLAFSDFEGCPVPPIEAALCGNVVIGYPGWGGREYWDEPNFRDVEFGNMRDFVRKFYEVDKFSRGHHLQQMLAPGIDRLARRYGEASEVADLQLMAQRIGLIPARATAVPGAPIKTDRSVAGDLLEMSL